jgi:hypothetical protein
VGNCLNEEEMKQELEGTLNIRLEPPQQYATLAELKAVADQVQKTLNAIVRNLTDEPEAEVETHIIGAEIGSLSLALSPSIPETLDVNATTLCMTLVKDVRDIREQRFRPRLTPGLLQQYVKLVNTLRSSHTRMQLQYGEEIIMIDDLFRKYFQAATKERVAVKVSLIGRIEAINIHSKPYEFRLFLTQPGTEPVRCTFEESLLHAVIDEMKRRSLVRITGKGYYAPIGLHPTKIELEYKPEPLTFDKNKLLSYVRSLDIVPEGMTISELLSANRKEAGIEEED